MTLLVPSLERESTHQLLDVVAVADPVVPKDVAVVPEALNDARSVVGGHVVVEYG